MSIDILGVLQNHLRRYSHRDGRSARAAIEEVIKQLEELIEIDYLGDLYRTDYEVEGMGPFPSDMLRYTQSWPAREEDSVVILGLRTRCVRLTKYHRDPEPVLSGDRWESKFRWRVVRVIETVKF